MLTCLKALWNTLYDTVLHSASYFVQGRSLGAPDNSVSGLAIIVVVTQVQGEPSLKTALCFEESGLHFFQWV